MLDALFNVKYIITIKSIESNPYGYNILADSYTDSEQNKYYAYQNEFVLPFGYTYSYYIPEEMYKNLTAIQKQQA
jgi:hypothetical protein